MAQAQEVWRDSASAEARHALADATDQLLPAMNEHLALEEERVVPLIEKYDTQAEYAHVAREGSAEVPPDKLPVMADMFRYEADTAAIDLAVADMPAEAQPVIRDLAAKAYAAYEGPVRHLRSSPRDELIPGRFGPALQRLQASGEESKR